MTFFMLILVMIFHRLINLNLFVLLLQFPIKSHLPILLEITNGKFTGKKEGGKKR